MRLDGYSIEEIADKMHEAFLAGYEKAQVADGSFCLCCSADDAEEAFAGWVGEITNESPTPAIHSA